MTRIPQLDSKTAAVSADSDLIFVFQDGSKKPVAPKGPYSGLVAKFRQGGGFEARCGSAQFVAFAGKGKAKHVMLVGLGAVSELTQEKARVAGSHALSRFLSEKTKSVNIHVDSLSEAKSLKDPLQILKAFAEGLILSAYKYDRYKSDAKEEVIGPSKFTYVSKDKELQARLSALVKDVMHIAECVTVTRDWSNEPCNTGIPEYYAKEAMKLAKAHGIQCKVLNEEQAAKEKMNLFLAVGAGSIHEGRIVVLDYHPKAAEKTVALVGKGITFDSGGISIKPSAKMEDMKHDMTGAATMMGAILLAAKRKVKNRVIAILAFTENMPDGMATNPSSVIKTRNGKTVEIINTDAEGRLILSDVLDYAHDFKPDCIVDAATLTGAVTVALGKQCCGIMGNDDGLIGMLKNIGDQNYERMWQLPLFDEYLDDMKTDVADLRNSCNDPYGGSIRGGIFLKQFIKNGIPWAHMDIAATAYGMGHVAYYPKKGASGMHVRTLAQFVAEFE
jgi:leucyl aminopeptidase